MGFAVSDDDKIVRISHEDARNQVASFPERRHLYRLVAVVRMHALVYPLFGDVFIQNVQIDVRQQRGQNSALRRTFFIDFAFAHNSCFEHGLDYQQHALVLDAHMIQAFQKDIVVNAVKAFGNIAFHNPEVTVSVNRSGYSFKGHFGIAHRPESVGVFVKLTLHDGLQYDAHTFLHYSVTNCRNAQRALLLLSRLVYVLSANESRFIVPESVLDVIDYPVLSAL